MKKTVQVNIGGCAFNIDEESYSLIEEYMGGLKRFYNNTLDGKEIVEDIEERMAELLLERCGTGNVVSVADARYVIGILGTPAAFAEESGADNAKPQERPKKRLYRNPEGRIIGGVCNGLAAYWNWDVTLIRLIAAILFLASFASEHFVLVLPVLYILCWIAMPNADTVQKQCEMRGEQLSAAGIGQQYAAFGPSNTQPAGRTAGRVLGVILGIFLFMTGLSSLCGGVFAFCLPSLAGLNPEIASWWAEIVNEFGLESIMPLGISTLIVAAVAYAIPCILAIYYGILLTFNLKSPKWRPGLILVLIWVISLIALAVLVGMNIIKIIPLIN
ncbi:MAG: PspC domain-containing protein [Bacteroidales bacterium]|nr:PspC domain-containing protein [Bacteroidales bacterium]